MANDECKMMHDECSGAAAGCGTEQSVHPSSLRIHPFPIPIPRFSFPAVPESHENPTRPAAPEVVWPVCPDAETNKAGAEIAEAILRRLSLHRPTVVALTSPGDGDGKTSLLVALAPQLAKAVAGGVLLVDANPRRPSLTAQLNVPAGERASEPRLIYPTNLQRLSVLPAPHCWGGSCTAAPGATVQRSPQQKGVDRLSIEDLREGWSLVLLDMASLAHAEVALLMHCCDGVYLAVRVGHTTRRAVRESARLIRASGSRLLGCVVVK